MSHHGVIPEFRSKKSVALRAKTARSPVQIMYSIITADSLSVKVSG